MIWMIFGTPTGTRTQINGLGNRCSIHLSYGSSAEVRMNLAVVVCLAREINGDPLTRGDSNCRG